MKRHPSIRLVSYAVVVLLAGCTASAYAQDSGCRTAAVQAVDVYLLSNPLYAFYLGSLEEYVAENKSHFVTNGDAVRCLASLSTMVLRASFQLYDPGEQRRHDQIAAELGKLGISPGQQTPSASTEMFNAAQRMARLVRGLPAAASGDWRLYLTPADDYQQMIIFGEQMLRGMLQDPTMRSIMAQMEPLIREQMKLEAAALLRQATVLAESDCGAAPTIGECGQREAIRALQAGSIADAKQAFLRVRRADPSNERWPAAEAVIWYKLGRLTEAEEANRQALAINANHFTAHDNLAFVLFDRGRASEALTHWDAALVIRPDDPDAMAGKAIALEALQRHQEALGFYRRAVRANEKYLDCEVMRQEFMWSSIACDAAAGLIHQLR